jgi:ElaB/YqjD/DUF883 family membrane-anchored ribosome-binding protein
METNETSARSRATSNNSGANKRARNDDESLKVVADDAVRSVGALYKVVNESLQRQTEEAPYVALGAAAAVGFIVGGGLASPLGQALLRTTLRAVGGPLLQSVLNASVEAVERRSAPKSE